MSGTPESDAQASVRPDAAPEPGRPRAGRRRLRTVLTLGTVLVAVTACSPPTFGFPNGITVQSDRVLNIWKGSFIAAMIVGIFVWGLIAYAVIAFRKKSDELPKQIQYNLPVEILYTIVPLIIIAGLFYYTAKDESYLDKLPPNPQVSIHVIGFRWNWQFQYMDTGKNGTEPVEVTGAPGSPAVLVLPTDRTIRFYETSPDVIHSFWVPEFLFKRDVIPGRTNEFELTIKHGKEGTYIGRCAELCGVDHDRMNFYVKVVSPSDYDKYLAGLTAGAGSAT